MVNDKSAPDWGREQKGVMEWAPSKSLIYSYRSYKHFRENKKFINLPLLLIAKIRYIFWSAICGADINPGAIIGGGLILPHPNGVVIHGKAIIGTNCMLMQQVTIGQLADDEKVPQIGNNVYIGAGARVLGGVRLGDGCSVGANAVVLIDVPESATAVGVPAKIVKKKI